MTAASNSEARKRAAEAVSNSESAALAANSPNRGDDTSEATNGPQNATQRVRDLIALEVAAAEGVDSGAIGRLNETERAALRLQVRQALVAAWRDDYSVATVVSGVAECLEGYLDNLVREHADRALAEVEAVLALADDLTDSIRCGLHCAPDGKRSPYCWACEDSGEDHDCPPREDCEHTVPYRKALAYRAARKEQGR